MTRKEALDILMSANVWNDEERTAWEVLVPELAESEDERIRKELIEAFKAYDITSSWNGFPVKSILVWLEKQKEQKPVDYEHEMWKNCEANFEGGKKEVIEHPEKYGLQKPAEWSEEDERKRLACIETINEVIDYERERWEDYNPGKPYRPIMKYDEQVDWLKSLRPSWKPSEHQMNILKAVKEYVGRGSGYWGEGLGSLIEDLEKL